MVAAIRYWMRAARVMHPVIDQPTELGQYLFDGEVGQDPFLEDRPRYGCVLASRIKY